jgi:hypothetical protein
MLCSWSNRFVARCVCLVTPLERRELGSDAPDAVKRLSSRRNPSALQCVMLVGPSCHEDKASTPTEF